MNVVYGHTNVISRDWKRLAQFYVDVFQCSPKPPERDLAGRWLDDLTAIDKVEIRGIHLTLPGFGPSGPTLEIFEYGANKTNRDKAINAEGFGHIAFAVDDVEECLRRVLERGGSVVGEVVHGDVAGVGPIHMVYARDPEGNIVEIQKWE